MLLVFFQLYVLALLSRLWICAKLCVLIIVPLQNFTKMSDLYNVMKEEHEKYLKVDEDEILNQLTADELEQLTLDLEELDPEVKHCCVYVLSL